MAVTNRTIVIVIIVVVVVIIMVLVSALTVEPVTEMIGGIKEVVVLVM